MLFASFQSIPRRRRRKGENTHTRTVLQNKDSQRLAPTPRPARQHSTSPSTVRALQHLLPGRRRIQTPTINTSPAPIQPCPPPSAAPGSGDPGGWHPAGAWSAASITHLHSTRAQSPGKREKLPSFNAKKQEQCHPEGGK